MRIVHVFRAPVGGLFRHVMDLAREQARRGHAVGIFCDSNFAGERNERLLADLAQSLSLGLERAPMQRNPGPGDVSALSASVAFCGRIAADVVHGHGAKGGLYARAPALLGRRGPVRAYTPHGGSLNYFPGSLASRAYMLVERLLEPATDLFLFESRYIADKYAAMVRPPRAEQRIVLNGLFPHELEPVAPAADASDFLFIGEFRFAKGIDTMLAAMRRIKAEGERLPTMLLVGQGPDEAEIRQQIREFGLDGAVRLSKPMAAREAFGLARTMIVPSRFESLPYVVIEAAGAMMPLISTDVGGIPEIFGSEAHRLIPANDVDALVGAMRRALLSPDAERQADARRLQAWIAETFSVSQMATTVLEGYESAASRKTARRTGGAVMPATAGRRG
jgi:glycosyltransferase involved in cell wall biosynthesis